MAKTIISHGYDNTIGSLVVRFSDGSVSRAARINGTLTAAPDGALAYKYADPTEGATWLYSESKIDEIEAEDPSLIVRV